MTHEILEQREVVSGQLIKKWSKLLPPGTPYGGQIAVVLENESRHLARLAEDMPTRMPKGEMLQLVGHNWPEKVLSAIAKTMGKSPLMEMVSVQPFLAQPIFFVCYEVDPNKTPLQELIERVCDGFTYQLQTHEVRAEARKTRTRFQPRGTVPFQRILDEGFEEFFCEEIVREVLGNILNSVVPHHTTKTTLSGLSTDLQWALKVTHRGSGRSSADWVVTRPDLAREVRRLQPQLKIREDPHFPKGKILLFRSPVSPYDADTIYSPYIFSFDEMSATPELDKGPHYALRARHKIIITSTKGSYVLEVV